MRRSRLLSRAPHVISRPIRLAAVATVIAPLIHLPISTLIELTVFSSIHLPVIVAIFSPIQLSILTSIFLAIQLMIFSSIFLSILLPIHPAIFLSDIRLGEYHIRQDGWGRHGHGQAGNRSGFQQTVLHDACSFC